MGEMAPPRIVSVTLREEPEGVDETGIHQILESPAFFVRETLLAAIRLGVGQIELGMRHIEVAAENDRLGLLQLRAIGEEGGIPMLESQRQTAEIVLGVRRVHRHDVEFSEFRRHDPPFLGAVALQFIGEGEAFCKLERETVGHGQRLLLRKDRRAGIALLHRGIPVLAIVGQIDLELPALGLGLLKTDDVGLKLLEKRLEYPLLDHCANAVDVPGENLHRKSPGSDTVQPAPRALYTAIKDVAASVRLCDSSNSALSAVRSASRTSRKSINPPSNRLRARSAALSLAAAASCSASRRDCERP